MIIYLQYCSESAEKLVPVLTHLSQHNLIWLVSELFVYVILKPWNFYIINYSFLNDNGHNLFRDQKWTENTKIQPRYSAQVRNLFWLIYSYFKPMILTEKVEIILLTLRKFWIIDPSEPTDWLRLFSLQSFITLSLML